MGWQVEAIHSGECRECGKLALFLVTIEGPRYVTHAGVRILARPAVRWPLCHSHYLDLRNGRVTQTQARRRMDADSWARRQETLW